MVVFLTLNLKQHNKSKHTLFAMLFLVLTSLQPLKNLFPIHIIIFLKYYFKESLQQKKPLLRL